MPNHPKMPYRSLGNCGTKVSAFSLGGWTTFGGSVKDSQSISEIIHFAFDQGINFYDIADIYAKGQSEIEMGKVLKNFPRNELVISSKVYFPISDDINDRGLSRKHIAESINRSLKNIGTDYLDLYFCHRFDPETPLIETIRSMNDLIHQGKIHYWGTSQWSVENLQEAHSICEKFQLIPPQVEQPEYNLINRHHIDEKLRPFVQKSGMGVVTWSPLASGVLSGKYSGKNIPQDSRLANIDWLRERLLQDNVLVKADQLVELATKYKVKASQLALAWTVAQKNISSVILGVSRKEQLQENLQVLELKIPQSALEELDRLFK